MSIDRQALAVLTAAAPAGGVVTWIVSALLRKLCPCVGVLSYVLATIAAPAATVTIGLTFFEIDTAQHPTADLPALALAGYISLAGLMLLVTTPVAFFTLRSSSRPK